MATRFVRFALAFAIGSGLLTLLYGGLDRWLALYLSGWFVFGLAAMSAIDNDLARERFHPPEPGADRVPLRFIRLTALIHIVVGVLDAGRWQLGAVAPPVRVAALAIMVGAMLLVVMAMRANRFFSPVVRIQTERGHRVVDRGPYGVVRHPGYLGMIAAIIGSGLALGSWLAVGIGLSYAALIFRRVFFEDAFLKANLAGYAEYAQRVRHRLIPGAW